MLGLIVDKKRFINMDYTPVTNNSLWQQLLTLNPIMLYNQDDYDKNKEKIDTFIVIGGWYGYNINVESNKHNAIIISGDAHDRPYNMKIFNFLYKMKKFYHLANYVQAYIYEINEITKESKIEKFSERQNEHINNIYDFYHSVHENDVINENDIQYRDQNMIVSPGVCHSFTADDEIYSSRSWTRMQPYVKTLPLHADNRISAHKDTEGRKNDWLNLLGEYDAVVVTCSFSHPHSKSMLVGKVPEVLARGCLLFVGQEANYNSESGLIDNYNCIIFTKNNFNEKVEEYIKNRADKKYLEIRKNGVKLIKKKHTHNHRMQIIKTLLEKLKKKQDHTKFLKLNYKDKVITFNYKEDDYICKYWQRGMFYEWPLLEKIKSLGLKGTYLDVGAHFGNHGIYFDKFCDSEKVICIEGNPNNFEYLQINCNLNSKNIDAINYIISDKDDETYTMGYGCKTNSGGSMVLTEENKKVVQSAVTDRKIEYTDIIDNKSRKLDTLFNNIENISLIKFDIEGFEYFGLIGCENIIKKHKPVIILELWEYNSNYKLILDFLKKYNYVKLDNIDYGGGTFIFKNED